MNKKAQTRPNTEPTTTDPRQKGSATWQSPSNIALIKYWGKTAVQIPKNPSISFTLSAAHTRTRIDWEQKETQESGSEIDFTFLFHDAKKPEFQPKLTDFFQRIHTNMPFLSDYRLKISSENTFPHSSGIASSASAMSALAAALVDMEHQINSHSDQNDMGEDAFRRRASGISRLGSGSACRSLFPRAAMWGESSYPGSSDEYAIGLSDQLHPLFQGYHDDILLVDQGSKPVTSTSGHQLMEDNPYAETRYAEARHRTVTLMDVLKTGDLERFVSIVEAEALTLHALMMTSNPGFILMHPNTIEIIHRIRAFRQDSQIPVCFTLDAGPNVHLLYPHKNREQVQSFITSTLLTFCENQRWIQDKMGPGTQKYPLWLF